MKLAIIVAMVAVFALVLFGSDSAVGGVAMDALFGLVGAGLVGLAIAWWRRNG